MKRTLSALLFLMLLWAGSASAQTPTVTPTATPTPVAGYTINAKGTQWAAVPVGTATPVTILDQRDRCSQRINWIEAGDLMCAPIQSGTTPDFVPSATQGYRFVHGSPVGHSLDAMIGWPNWGWQCVSSSGTLNIYTLEFLTCRKKGSFP
jgi:hypothetical protein